MKFRKDELTSVALISTRGILASLETFQIVLSSGMATQKILESMDENMTHYKQAVNFSNQVIDQLDEKTQLVVKDNINLIYTLIENIDYLISDLYLND
jgi:hypothetical protein